MAAGHLARSPCATWRACWMRHRAPAPAAAARRRPGCDAASPITVDLRMPGQRAVGPHLEAAAAIVRGPGRRGERAANGAACTPGAPRSPWPRSMRSSRAAVLVGDTVGVDRGGESARRASLICTPSDASALAGLRRQLRAERGQHDVRPRRASTIRASRVIEARRTGRRDGVVRARASCARDLDAGRAAADHHEGQNAPCARPASGVALGLLEQRREHPDRAGRRRRRASCSANDVLLPLVVAEVRGFACRTRRSGGRSRCDSPRSSGQLAALRVDRR